MKCNKIINKKRKLVIMKKKSLMTITKKNFFVVFFFISFAFSLMTLLGHYTTLYIKNL